MSVADQLKHLQLENARLLKEIKRLSARVEKLSVDKSLYKLRIRATEDENKRLRESKGLIKCRYDESDSD